MPILIFDGRIRRLLSSGPMPLSQLERKMKSPVAQVLSALNDMEQKGEVKIIHTGKGFRVELIKNNDQREVSK